jgi:hypothetical protein
MGRSHSFFKASDNTNYNAKNKLPDDIACRITFSHIIPARESLRLPPTKCLIRRGALATMKTAITSRTASTSKTMHHRHRRISARTAEAPHKQEGYQPNHHDTGCASFLQSNRNFQRYCWDSELENFVTTKENPNSDDGVGISKKRALEWFPTFPQAPYIDGERAISVTPAVPAALWTPFTPMRTPSSMVTRPTAPPQLTELVQCPSVTP